VAVSREGGSPTIEERERAETGELHDAARSDPAVEAILKQFPGSRVIDVRLRGEDHAPDALQEEGDATPGDFFD
jgi:DNA polymerase III subunit gamma/tau